MSSLQDLVGKAKQNATLQVRGVENSVTGGLAGAIGNSKNNIQTGISSGVNQTINAGVRGVVGAAGDFLTGDFSGGLTKIGNIGSDVSNALGKITGLNFGSSLTGSFDGGFVSSSNNGIEPGNALAGIQARADPMFNFLWFADMPVINPVFGGAVSLPWYYVEESNTPFRHIETRSIFREGRMKQYPGSYSVDALRLGIYSDVTNVALGYLQAWNDLVLSPTSAAGASVGSGRYGNANSFKKTIKIYLLAPAKQQLVLLEYVECWPTGIDAYALASASSDRLMNHVTFSVGDVFMTLFDVSSSLLNSFLNSGQDLPESIRAAVANTYSRITAPVFNTARDLGNSIIADVSSIFD